MGRFETRWENIGWPAAICAAATVGAQKNEAISGRTKKTITVVPASTVAMMAQDFRVSTKIPMTPKMTARGIETTQRSPPRTPRGEPQVGWMTSARASMAAQGANVRMRAILPKTARRRAGAAAGGASLAGGMLFWVMPCSLRARLAACNLLWGGATVKAVGRVNRPDTQVPPTVCGRGCRVC